MNTQDAVYEKLKALSITYTLTNHPAVFNMADIAALGLDFDGAICKNLFLRDANGKRHFLVVLAGDKQADLKAMRDLLSTSALSFASEERLAQHLKLTKGAVTPFGVLNNDDHAVTVVFDSDLIGRDKLGFHPNVNTATVFLSFADIKYFVESCGNPVQIIRLP